MANKSVVPIPKIDLAVREATVEDVAFIDALQKVHRRQVGFMPAGQLQGKIKAARRRGGRRRRA